MHTFGIPVFAATITPSTFPSSLCLPHTILTSTVGAQNATAGTYTQPARVATVQRVNNFIRTSGIFDAVFDFNAWLADPSMPTQLNPKYDSGDFLHPNEAGYQVLANNFDLAIFQKFKGGVSGYM